MLTRWFSPTQLGAALALLAVLIAVKAVPQDSVPEKPQTSPATPVVLQIDIDGVIHPVASEFIKAGMERAEQEHASLILIQLSTPGGMDTSMREIIERIIASRIPVAVYVGPSGKRAASAGYYILLSADIAAMAPGTNTGAAHPVMMGGEMDETMKEKVGNDAAAYLRSITSKRGRNPKLAETGVIESKSFTEQEALDGHLIDLIADSRDDLLKQLDGRQIARFNGTKVTLALTGATVEKFDPSFRQDFLSRVLDPNIAFLLLIFGVLGLYVEFSNPGMILPGAAGGICLILGLFALSLLPVNWAGVALLVLSGVLFVLEAKFVSHGILGVSGVLAMILGAVMLIDSRLPGGGVALPVAVAVALPFGLITIFLLRLVVRARRAKVSTGDTGMVGELGRVEIAIQAANESGPAEGKVYVHGELWSAVSDAPIAAGTQIRVRSMQGLVLNVEPLAQRAHDKV
jgi:membrane-bound serine protease (ClpP class)